jgi:hypothetical protein
MINRPFFHTQTKEWHPRPPIGEALRRPPRHDAEGASRRQGDHRVRRRVLHIRSAEGATLFAPPRPAIAFRPVPPEHCTPTRPELPCVEWSAATRPNSLPHETDHDCAFACVPTELRCESQRPFSSLSFWQYFQCQVLGAKFSSPAAGSELSLSLKARPGFEPRAG